MRADALLVRYGYCTRREAAARLHAGSVRRKDGTLITSPALHVEPREVLIDGREIPFPDGMYIALHKPIGYVCSHAEESGSKRIFELLPTEWERRHPSLECVGRLDKDTSGLLLLSDNGIFVHRLTSPRQHVTKVYSFETTSPVPVEAVALFMSGTLMLRGEKTPCLPAKLELTDLTHGRLRIEEGRYHQVRRMLAAVGAPIVRLHREAVGALELDTLRLVPGEWCNFDPTVFEHGRE